jgi:hypothetical protein
LRRMLRRFSAAIVTTAQLASAVPNSYPNVDLL